MVSAVHAVLPATWQPLWEVEKEVLNEQMLVKVVLPHPCAGARLCDRVTSSLAPDPKFLVQTKSPHIKGVQFSLYKRDSDSSMDVRG